jgi:transposase
MLPFASPHSAVIGDRRYRAMHRGLDRRERAHGPGSAHCTAVRCFTATSSPWLNLVERVFAEIKRQRIRRGVFKSVADLEAAIQAWIAERNSKPKPFKWTAKADTILAKNARARLALQLATADTK